MTRPTLARPIFAAAILAALFAVAPANAQFGSIFGDGPPRPPADVPRGNTPPSNFPSGRDLPSQRDPVPTNAPPAGRQGLNEIQSQPLPPPPGAPAAPLDTSAPTQTQPQQVQPPQGQQPVQQQASPNPVNPNPVLPGLPPGQRQPRGVPQPADTTPQPGDEIVVQPPEQKIANPTAVFSGLDKITGRTISFDVAINETVQFGALQVTPRACYTRPPTETPNTDSFVAVDEVTLQGEVKRIFTGWMFAASPGLHAVEHPVYDVWLTDCKGATPAVAQAPVETPKPEAKSAAKPAAKPATKPAAKPAQAEPRRSTAQPNFLNPFR
jgi:hypothetical protein